MRNFSKCIAASTEGIAHMYANITVTLCIHDGEVRNRLMSFLRLAESSAAPDVLARAGLEVDGRLAGLLDNFPSDVFWPAVCKLDHVQTYVGCGSEGPYSLEFESVEYPYAEKFAQQIETWMGALGCNDVSSSVERLFSQSARTNILHLSHDYKQGRLAVFLGAGVSSQIGLPLWEELLDRLVSHYMDKAGTDQALRRSLQSRDAVERARCLKRMLNGEYLESVRNALYRDAYQSGVPSSPVIEALSRMQSLRAVCSYNYDDSLERQPGTSFRAIASATDGYNREETPVYHVHGLLPFIGTPRGNLVFTEDDYHELANQHPLWANVVQYHLLRECTCLLIGISCRDPNLRRILHQIGDDKSGETYIIQKMEEIGGADPDTLRAWRTTKEFDRDCHADMHLLTIWIHSYDDIPGILNSCMDAPAPAKKKGKKKRKK
jgi:SIR2-like domain